MPFNQTLGTPILTAGDIENAGGGNLAIRPDKVTYGKMQPVSNGSRVLGSGSGYGLQDVREVGIGSLLAMSGNTLNCLAVGSVGATAPVVSSGGQNPVISMAQAGIATDGYLDSLAFNVFNNKQEAIILTTSGNSGPSTLVGGAMDIPQYSLLPYMSAVDLTTQTNATTVNRMQFGTVLDNLGVTIVSGDQITFSEDGMYNIQFSAQLEKTDAGTDEVEIWLYANGTSNVADSSTIVSLKGNGAKQVAAWNWFYRAVIGDFVQIVWYSADPNVQLTYRAAASTPTRPAIPSVILTVNKVSE